MQDQEVSLGSEEVKEQGSIPDYAIAELNQMLDNYEENQRIQEYYSKTTRRQRRSYTQTVNKEYNKARFNFEKFVSSLTMEQVEFFEQDFKNFDQNQFKIKSNEFERIKRGLVSYNYNSRDWTAWQREIFMNFKNKASRKNKKE